MLTAKSFKSFLPGVLFWCLSLYLFTMPVEAMPTEDWMTGLPIDKLVHIGIFAVLVFLFYRPFRTGAVAATSSRWMFIIPLLGLAYGISIELVQKYLVTNRGFELLDIVADAAGCTLAYFIGANKAKG